MSVAGAYWRGTRTIKCAKNIWNGVSQEVALEEHLPLEEAKKRDHRKLGKELGLFMFSEEAPGMPFFCRTDDHPQ